MTTTNESAETETANVVPITTAAKATAKKKKEK